MASSKQPLMKRKCRIRLAFVADSTSVARDNLEQVPSIRIVYRVELAIINYCSFQLYGAVR